MEENQVPTNQTSPNISGNVSFPGSVPSAPRKRSNKWIYIVIAFVIIIIVIAFLVFKGSQGSSQSEETPTPDTTNQFTNNSEATPTPTPTPSPSSASKDQVKIQILNGTGIAGEAAYLQGKLRPLGYTNITAANADNTSNTATQITFASSVSQDVMTEITTQLKSIYESVQTDTSQSLTSVDVQIITGLRKGATPLPSDTPTPTPTPTQ